MNLSSIFSTEERVKIVSSIIYLEEPTSVVAIAKEAGLSKGLVSKLFKILVKEGILTKLKNRFVVLDNVYVKAIRIMLMLNNFTPNLFKKYKFVKGVGIYGSCVKGNNTKNSDIDLWIKVEKTREMELAKLTGELKRKYENVKPLFLTKEKIKILENKDPVFYYSLVLGSITIYGEEIEI